MVNRYGRLLLNLGVMMVFVLWVNDFMAALVREAKYGQMGYFLHLALFAAAAAYAVCFKHQAKVAARRLAACRFVWRQLPCALAVVRPGEATDIYGDDEIIRLCGLALGAFPGGPPERRENTEEYFGPDGERFIERRIIPLTGFNGDGYAGEFLLDVSARVTKEREREREYIEMLKILVNMFEMKDPYSNGHSEAVSNLARDLAQALGLVRAAVDVIARAALLHDIGKIVIPPETLNKAGPLSPAEYDAVKAHATVGAEILANLGIFREEAGIVRHHHERFDGHGYPDGLRDGAIPLGARIIAVADAFDAMTVGRSVHGRRGLADVFAILAAEKGRQFDPAVVDAFIDLVKTGDGQKEMRRRR